MVAAAWTTRMRAVLYASESRCLERSFHSSSVGCGPSVKKNAARDSRVAGRRRFYKVVGVELVDPPWHGHDDTANNNDEEDTVENPISAGVDGTQSATGVSHRSTEARGVRHTMLDRRHHSPPRWYGISLDKKLIRTPLGTSPLSVPSLPLALALASEWDSQLTTIQPAQMPLMTLTCTALDQVASYPEIAIQNVLRYLRNDTTCYLSDPLEERGLHKLQMQHWEELHTWTNQLFGTRLAMATGATESLLMSRSRTGKKNGGLPHPHELMKESESWIRGLDAWTLTALQSVTVEAKSFLVGKAIVRGLLEDGNAPFADETYKAVRAARVEEEFQIENWGLVEGGHDYDRLNCSVGVHAAAFLIGCIAANSNNNNNSTQ